MLMRILAVFAIVGLLSSAFADEDDSPVPLSEEILPRMLAEVEGEYRLVGQMPRSGPTYSGTVVLRQNRHELVVTRTIGGSTVVGTATLGAIGPGRTIVLTMHLPLGGEPHEGRYLLHIDLENLVRLTGHVYPKRERGTDDPALEVLFANKRI